MPSKTPIGIFLAAAAALSTNAIIPVNSIAGERHGDMGGKDTREGPTGDHSRRDGRSDKGRPGTLQASGRKENRKNEQGDKQGPILQDLGRDHRKRRNLA